MNREQHELQALTNMLRSMSSDEEKKNFYAGGAAVVIGLLSVFIAYGLFKENILPGLWWGVSALFSGVFLGIGSIYVQANSNMEF